MATVVVAISAAIFVSMKKIRDRRDEARERETSSYSILDETASVDGGIHPSEQTRLPPAYDQHKTINHDHYETDCFGNQESLDKRRKTNSSRYWW